MEALCKNGDAAFCQITLEPCFFYSKQFLRTFSKLSTWHWFSFNCAKADFHKVRIKLEMRGRA